MAASEHLQPNQFSPGDTACFEYHCLESHESSDAEAWYRSHQQVTVLHKVPDVDEEEVGGPMYRVRHADTFEHDVWNDELMTSPKGFTRPAPPKRPVK